MKSSKWNRIATLITYMEELKGEIGALPDGTCKYILERTVTSTTGQHLLPDRLCLDCGYRGPPRKQYSLLAVSLWTAFVVTKRPWCSNCHRLDCMLPFAAITSAVSKGRATPSVRISVDNPLIEYDQCSG